MYYGRTQAASSGGRVHVFVNRAITLPDKDTGPFTGVSDPYVKFEVGSTVARTSVVEESLNPVRYIA